MAAILCINLERIFQRIELTFDGEVVGGGKLGDVVGFMLGPVVGFSNNSIDISKIFSILK